MWLQCRRQLTHRRGAVNAELRRVAQSQYNLIGNNVQPVGGPPLTPTLSHEYAGEGAGMLPLPFAGEGWGEGGSNS